MKKLTNLLKLTFFILIYLGLVGLDTLADPTKPPGAINSGVQGEGSHNLDLTAIFIYPTYRVAIIGGRILMLGDKIDEYIITTISPNTVELTGSDQKTLMLNLVSTIKQRRN